MFGISFILVNKIEKVEFYRKSNLLLYKEYVYGNNSDMFFFSVWTKNKEGNFQG